MARSGHIYMVRNASGGVLSAFTVKRECLAWAEKNVIPTNRRSHDVLRAKDGGGAFERMGSVYDLLREQQ